MLSLLLEIRKRIITPFFISRNRKKQVSKFEYPPKEELFQLERELRVQLPIAKRAKDLRKEHELLGKLQLIDWLVRHD